ncbi:MAG: hypothetical protein WCW62_10810 [Bacteroidales bacterium]
MNYFLALVLGLICGLGGKMQVTESTSREWVGGLQESGYGTDFQLKLLVKAGSDQLQFDELWVGDIHMKVRLIADPANLQTKEFKKGSQITVKAGLTYRPGPDEKIQLQGADLIQKPVNFKGEGLLGYTYKGHKAYLVIREFKKLEKLIYP